MVAKRKDDEVLWTGSVIYWSQQRRDGRYPGGRIRWRVPVRCGRCGQVREVDRGAVTGKDHTGLCPSCGHGPRTEDEELASGSVVYWSQRFEGERGAGDRGLRRVPVRCGMCGQVRAVSASRARQSGFTGLCLACANVNTSRARMVTEDEELASGSVVYWSQCFEGGRGAGGRVLWRVPVRCGECRQARVVSASRAKASGFTGLCHSCSLRRTQGSDAHKKQLRRKRSRCQLCGLAEPDILIVHHKDNNRENNEESNLMVLCPNRHARVHRGRLSGLR